MLAQAAAVFATVLIAGVVVLQFLLALGAPLGRFVWRGQHRVLPVRLRLGSGLAAAILAGAAWIILARVGLVAPGPVPAVRVAAWIAAGFFALNTAGNLMSPSRSERLLMSPVTIALILCFLLAALA